MDIQICKEFMKNMSHGYALLKFNNSAKCELVEYNQEFEKMFNIKDQHIADFIAHLKANKDSLSICVVDGIEDLVNCRTNEYVCSLLSYDIMFNKQTLDNVEYIFIMIINVSEKMQSNIKNYESILNSSRDMFMVSDYNGNILFANSSVSRKLGYSQEELGKMHSLSLHPKDRRKEAEEIFGEMIQKNIDVCPLPLATKNGQLIPVETRAWIGEWNGSEHIFSISKDLSEEQNALQRFTKMFKKNPACMAIISMKDGKYTQVNDAFIKTFGFTEAEVIGKTGIELKIIADVEIYEQGYKELSSSGFYNEKIIKARKKNGELVTGSFSGTIIESQSEKFIMSSMIDLTKQIESEERLKTKSALQHLLLELASRYINCSLDNFEEEIQQSLERIGFFIEADRVCIFDYDFKASITSNTFEWCNSDIKPEIENLQSIPLESIPDWVSTHLRGEPFIVKDVASLDGETSSVKEILEPQGVKSLITLPMMFGDNCLGFVGYDSVKKHRIYTEGEINLLKFYSQILANIKMRAFNEKAIQEAESHAIKANEAKNLFIAKTSHELRNPLNGAWGFINLLGDEIQTNKAKEYLSNSKKALKSVIQITNDLLDISKMESKDFELYYSTINIRKLLDETITPYSGQIIDQQIKLSLDIDNKIQKNLVGDYGRLKQIIGNLLLNAITHSKASTIEVRCEVLKQDFNSMELLFYIKDNGIGIAEEHKPKIFESFYKIDSNSTGSGLGLTITNELIEKMGGKLKLKSTINKGSTFSFSLPFSIEKAQKAEKDEPIDVLHDLSSIKILIAEDDFINRTLITEMLKPQGVSIVAVSNGVELLQELGAHRYDLILMDIQMPIMSGLEATKRIRELKNSIPIIAITAAILPEEKAKYYYCGINGIVEKPIFIDSLMQEIHLALTNSSGVKKY